MSKNVEGTTSINNRNILLQAFQELNINAQETSENIFSWGSGFRKMSIDLNSGKVRYDDMYKSNVEQLEQTYGKYFIIAEIRKKGHRVESVKQVGDEIEIIASY